MRFLILGLPKTGKTMLVNTLNRLPGFKVLGEILNTRGPNPNMPDHPQKVIQDMRVIDSINNLHTWYYEKYAFHHLPYIHDIVDHLTNDDIDAFMETIYVKDRHCAFKCHHHHIEMLPYLLTWLLERKDIKIIHCNRKNKIKQALAAIGNRARGDRFEADPQSTVNLINDNAQRLAQLRNWFAGQPFYQEFMYEDMTGDTNIDKINLKSFKEFLGVDMPDEIDILTKKNTRNKVSENLINYDEFVDFFKKTDYMVWID